MMPNSTCQKHWSAFPPRFVVEMRTIRWVGHAHERRKLLVHATYGGHRCPNL